MNDTVTEAATSQSRRPTGSVRSSAGTTCREAPTASAGHTSQITASKPGLEIWVQRSAKESSKASVCQATRLARLAWSTTTPLGWPVEPEVYTTYAGSSGRARAGAPQPTAPPEHHQPVGLAQPGPGRLVGYHRPGARVLQHPGDPLVGVLRV